MLENDHYSAKFEYNQFALNLLFPKYLSFKINSYLEINRGIFKLPEYEYLYVIYLE